MKIPIPDGSRLESIPSVPLDAGHTEWPGIFLKHITANGKEAASVLMEYDPTLNRIMLRVWGYDRPDEDPILTMPLSPELNTKEE